MDEMIPVRDWRMLLTNPGNDFRCPRCHRVFRDIWGYNGHLIGRLDDPPFEVKGCRGGAGVSSGEAQASEVRAVCSGDQDKAKGGEDIHVVG